MNRGGVQSALPESNFYGYPGFNALQEGAPTYTGQPDVTQISFQENVTGPPEAFGPEPLPSPSDTPTAPPGQGLEFTSNVAGGPSIDTTPYQYNIAPNPFVTAAPSDPNQYGGPIGPPLDASTAFADPNQYLGPIGPTMPPPPDPNVQIVTGANPNPMITDAPDAGAGGVIPAPPGVEPDVAPAVPITGPPGFGSPDFAASATPADQLPNAPGDIYATGQVGMRDASGNIIPGTALTPADAANIYNNQQFPNAVPGMPSSLSDPTNYGAVGQFFRDAAGNIVDAAGNIVHAASDLVSNIANNLANDPGYSSPSYLTSIGYTPGQGTGSLLPPEGFAGARGGPLPGGTAGLGSFSAGFLPNAWQNFMGRQPWMLRRPMTAEQWAQLTSFENFQGNALAGVNWANWAKQTGLPTPTQTSQNPFGNNYSQYLDMWNATQDVIAKVAAQRAAAARSGDGITRAVGPGVAGPGGAGRPATSTV